jgi:BolA protein
MDRVAAIRQRLQAALEPTSLDIRDDSDKHIGHASAQGAGHFTVWIVAEAFRGKNTITRHRMVYKALADLMPAEIHALSIQAQTPEEL